MSFLPTIAPDVFALRPDFVALSLHVQGARNAASDAQGRETPRTAVAELDQADWAEAHLESWRAAYRAFGAKPQRTPCSAEALRRRALRDGAPPSVNAIVDLYNAVSLRYALPIGGEDAALYQGRPELVRAVGGEPFDTVQDGAPRVEPVEPGEVVWRDARGVTCRRWNWRQGVRTRITAQSTDLWFVLERLDPMPLEALDAAGEAMIAGLRRLSPELTVTRARLGPV